MKRRSALPLLVAAALLHGCADDNDAPSRSTQLDATEVVVLQVAVAGLVERGELPASGAFVVADRTAYGDLVELLVEDDGLATPQALEVMFPLQGLPWRDAQEAELAFEGYLLANAEAVAVEHDTSFDAERATLLWMHESFEAHFAEHGPFDGWARFYEMFPGASGYYRFSRPALFEHAGFAVVHLDMGCGAVCGAGAYVLLRRDGNAWRFDSYFLDWIS